MEGYRPDNLTIKLENITVADDFFRNQRIHIKKRLIFSKKPFGTPSSMLIQDSKIFSEKKCKHFFI